MDTFWELNEKAMLRLPVSSAPRFTVLAPDILRTDSQENIFLQVEGLSTPVTASISIVDFMKTTTLLQDSVTLNLENGFHSLKTLQLPSDRLNRGEKKNKFVYLKVGFGDYHSMEKILMVSFHSGYIFIQTDKPIYKPGDTVRFRVFTSSPTFKAFNSSVTIDIKNPDGVVVKQVSRVRAVDGVFADTFPLSEIVNEGQWTVIANFDHWEQNTFTSQFQVKKYVLPAFNVTLTPRKSSLDLDDDELEVEIWASYLYGEPVQGTAYVVFGVKINQEMRRLPSVKQVVDLDGGVVKLSMEELKRAHPDIRSLVGSSVYVKASVLTKSGSDLVEAEKTGIKIVESPYAISFKNVPRYFKPGLPLDFTIQVSHHDGSPARNVIVQVTLLDTPLTVFSGTARATVNMPPEQRAQTITAETVQAGLRSEQQAKQQITVQPFIAFIRRNQNYLYISTGSNTVSVGDRLSLKLSITVADPTHRQHITHITYMVLNKGKIIVAERVDVAGQLITSIGLHITPEMMPSFRFVAFYSIPWEGGEEVVPDSIWVDVADSCVGGLNVGPVDGIRRDYTPGKSFSLQIRGDPGAKVNLVAVDNAVFLLNRDRLTQGKMWGTVEHGDIGCTRGGGQDALSVFSDAGLLFASSTGLQTVFRSALKCRGSARRRRSAEKLQHKAQLESHYKEKLLRRCCKDGLREIPMPYSCTRRSLYITEGWECMRAFRYCCATYRNEEINTEIPTTPPPLTTTPPTTTSLPSQHFSSLGIVPYGRIPPYRKTMGLGLERGLPGPPQLRPLADFVPKQRFQGVSLTHAKGQKHMPEDEKETVEAEDEEEEEEEEEEYLDETEVSLRFKFYESWLWMDVNLPTKADRDGLASTNVDHPLPDSITEWGVLAVSASAHTGFCVAEPYNFKAWKRFFVDLKLPYSVARNEQVEIKAVVHNYGNDELHVRVVLMKTEGMCSIAFKDRHTQQVMVVARDAMGGDRIRKLLNVVMDGVQKTEVWSAVLNPSADGGIQTVNVPMANLKSVVPNSVPETFINVRGNVLADSIDNSISEDSLASLIQMPGGCVEQNLASITLPLIATLYLETTDNWESVGVQRKAEALRYIRRGYENQLAYRKSDGSYPPYSREGPSTWITAYVVKVFSMAHSIVGINEQQVCDPLLYLVNNKHKMFRGNFVEDNPVYSTTMTGGLRGDDPETTLTAFVLIALAEAKQAGISCISPNVKVVIDQNYNPTQSLLSAAAPDGSHWPDSKNTLFTLEGTGYALLALVKLGRMEEAAAPFKWLNSQRRRGGGFGSTQSTMVVLQALSEYLIHKPPPADLSLDVDLRIRGRKEIRYHFDPETAYAARSSRLPAGLEMEVQARGNGQGILEVVTYYNQLHEVDEKMPCKDFELNVNIEESSEKPPADVEKSYQITIKVRALGPRDVRMVVLDISLPTGFSPENSDLEMLSNSVDHYINDFKIVDNLSDRGSLIIHLFKVSHKEPEILIFRLQQRFKVGLLQPSSVTVYEYYNPDHRCTHTYTPREDREELTQICQDNVCRCTQGDCCTFACTTLHHVFQVKVLSLTQSYYDKYEMEITKVIKLGGESGVEVGQKRVFMSHGGCRDDLNLQQGSQYLIMGPREDQWNVDTDTNRFVYMLGKDTWVERWPTPAECSSSPGLQAKCKTLEDTASELSVNGCRL
ncbi:hypothetical protein PBY51_019649 [Eleginops maclovinus]|uniref:Uncharacterized protein n=1 Tax=Eleginops maclovinus TaxID=56733 RepID=A0AAN7XQV4_ELEMC|nr:hypothetical protein PBY51_019649 [Eleginops maclovinus]